MTLNSASSQVLDAIRNRRTVRDFVDRPVPREVIEAMLESARWAPNHRHTEPWRVFVLQKDGDKRRAVANLVSRWTYENVKNPTPERRAQSAEQVRQEVLEAPAFIYVYAIPGPNEEVTRENYAAAACAVQNMMLTAYAHGVGAGWSTGKVCLPPELPALLGAGPAWQMVGALFIGYPARAPEVQRKAPAEFAVWL